MLRKRQVQHARRESADHELVAVRLLEGGGHRLRAHVAAVDEKELIGAVAARRAGFGNVTGQRIVFPAAADLDHLLRALPAEHGVDRAEELPVAGGMEKLLAVADHADRDLGVGDRQAGNGGDQRGSFDRVALHEFHSCRGVVEQVADDDRRAVGAADAVALGHDARVQVQTRAEIAVRGFGHQVDARDGGNGGERLAAEAERMDRF